VRGQGKSLLLIATAVYLEEITVTPAVARDHTRSAVTLVLSTRAHHLSQSKVENSAPWDQVLAPKAVRLDNDRLLPADAGLKEQTIWTGISSHGNVQLEATWGDGWGSGSRVGLLLQANQALADPLRHLAASADKRFLATATGSAAQVWDLSSQTVCLTLPRARSVAFSPDGKVLAVAAEQVRLLDMDTLQARKTLKDTGEGVTALAFSPDGSVLATGDFNGALRTWETASGELRGSVTAHAHKVHTVAFLPDGKALISWGGPYNRENLSSHKGDLSAKDGEATLKLWNLAPLRLERVLFHDKVLPQDLALSSDGQTLALNFHQSRVVLMDLASGKQRALPQTWAMAFSPDSRVLALVGHREIHLCQPRTGQVVTTLRDPRLTNPLCLAFGGDGRQLFAGDGRGKVFAWDVAASQLRNPWGAQSYSFLVRPSHNLAAAQRDDGPNRSLDSMLQENHALLLEIRRDGVLLRKETLAAARVPKGTLHLRMAREGHRLTFQVNDLPPMVFDEVFGLADQPGVFAVLWPGNAPLLRLRASQQLLPAEASPLEKGDALYARGRFADALAFYQEQAILAGAGHVGQECRYKQSLCLAALGREAEAAVLCQRLGQETGGRWPPLALCQLWHHHLKQRQFDEAEGVFASLRSRFDAGRLASLLPGDSRDAILLAYGETATGLHLYKVDPNRIRILERAARVEEFLFGFEQTGIRFSLARAYHAAGMLEPAWRLTKEYLGTPRELPNAYNWLLEYCWLCLLRKDARLALEELDGRLSKADLPRDQDVLLVERARLHAALDQWPEAEKDVQQVLAGGIRDRCDVEAALLLGFLRERRGDAGAAVRAWGKGLLPPEETSDSGAGFAFLHNLMLASLADKLSDADAEKYLAKITKAVAGDDSVIKVLTSNLRLPPSVFRTMWRTPRGKECARRIAFQEVSFQETLRLTAVLFSTEWAKQGALPDKVSPAQEELLWKTFEEVQAAYEKGQLPTNQLLPLALTWKGINGTFGWAGVEGRLVPELRGPLAYVFGHRYLRLNRPDDAQRFFQTARDHARLPAQDLVRRLAEEELQRLASRKK
jgi:WD40 repeat protein